MESQYRSPQQEKVGITECITQGKQILAITKYLFSDFIVNQIDKNQQVVCLHKKPDLNQIQPKQEFSYQMTAQLRNNIASTLSEEAAVSVQKLYHQLECGEKVSVWEFIIEKELDRNQRIAVHNFVREKLTQIDSTAVEGSGGKIKLRFNRNLRKMNPNARQKYTHFKLYKHGIDTFNALFRLSKVMGISNKLFSTAGLKDKRGHTTQLVSVYNTDLLTLKKFYRQADRNREMWIDQFEECKDDKVEIGGLFGNQFGLILRLINPSDQAQILQRCHSLQVYGMINYFGLQRFGQFSTKTYELGAMVMRKEWKTLIENIILSDCGNFQTNVLKKQIYESKEFFKAQRALHNKYKIQKLIFKGLQKYGQGYMNIFQTLPRSIRMLYTHALQSYIFNKVSSRRIKEHGLKLVINDIVGVKVQNVEKVVEQKNEEVEEDLQLVGEEEEVVDDEAIQTVLITQQNIHNYSIHDLVAPLFGPNSTVPNNCIIYSYIQEELKNMNLQEKDFLQNSKLYCFKGQFRKMIVKPNKVEAKILSYSQPKEQLLSPFYHLGEQTTVQKRELRALQLILQLPKSCYATMAIREILHVSSEFDIQMDLNREYEKRFLQNK